MTATAEQTIEVGTIATISESTYTAPAYRPANYQAGKRWGDDYTGENQAAHGNIVATQEESREGRRRNVAINQRHVEVGPWGPTRAQREAAAQREARKAVAKQQAEEDEAARQLGVSVIGREGDTVQVRKNDGVRSIPMRDIREAARDPHDPRLTPEAARSLETPEQWVARMAYRSLRRQALQW